MYTTKIKNFNIELLTILMGQTVPVFQNHPTASKPMLVNFGLIYGAIDGKLVL
jgi:hypothetical protein